MYKLRLYACCILWAVVFFALPAAAHNKFCGNKPCNDIGENSPVDTDKDGSLDYIICSDYDGDGTLEIFDDVQGCIDALTDTGNRHIYVMPGTYSPPTLTDCDAAGDTCYDAINEAIGTGGGGLIQLPSNTILECSGPRTTTLKTWNYPTDNTATTPDHEYANISNADNTGNSNIVVKNCGIQGGGASTYDSSSTGWGGANGNRGIQFYNVSDFIIDGTYCKNTYHACYFIENSQDGLLTNNTAEEDGGYNDSNGGSQASFYFHTCSEFSADAANCDDSDSPLSNILAIGSRVINSVGNAFNLRNDYGVTDISKNVSIFDSHVRDNVGSCARITGQTGAHIATITCDNTQGFLTAAPESSAYREGGNNYSNVNTTLENITVTNQATTSAGALNLQSYHDGTTVRNVSVDKSNQECMLITQPQRNLVVEGATLTNCGQDGIDLAGSATTITEGVTLKDISILDTDAEDGAVTGTRYRGLMVNNTLSYARIDGLTISGTSENPIFVNQASTDFVLKNVEASCTVPRYRGGFTEVNAKAQACNSNALYDTMMTTNAGANECIFLAGTSTEHNFCTCNNVITDITNITQASPGVVTTASAHGFSNDEEVFISGVEGMIEANDTLYTVKNVAALTFELGTTNTSGYTAYAAGSASGEAGQWALQTVVNEHGILFNSTVDDSVIDGIVVKNCKNGRGINTSGAVTDTTFSYIVAIDDPLYFDGATDSTPMSGALGVAAGSSNVTIDMSTFECISNTSACLTLDTDHTDLSAFSHYISAAGCAVACTNGALCTDTDGGAGATFFVCGDASSGAYSAP